MLTVLALLALTQAPPAEEQVFAPPTPPPIVDLDDEDQAAPPVEGDEAYRPEPDAAPTVSSVAAFEQPLAPYGTWVDVRGVRAWQPSGSVVGVDFVPYGSGGQWVSTRAGWVFESAFPFGWAVFHYGRWWYEDGLGWVWMPDTVWGPSWVDWRFGGGYTGWAPLPPPWLTSWHRPRWFFVETPWFCGRDLWRHRLAPGAFSVAYAATLPLAPREYGHVRWYVGPRWSQVAPHAVQPPVRRSWATAFPPHGAVPVHVTRTPLPTPRAPAGPSGPAQLPRPGYQPPSPHHPDSQPTGPRRPDYVPTVTPPRPVTQPAPVQRGSSTWSGEPARVPHSMPTPPPGGRQTPPIIQAPAPAPRMMAPPPQAAPARVAPPPPQPQRAPQPQHAPKAAEPHGFAAPPSHGGGAVFHASTPKRQ